MPYGWNQIPQGIGKGISLGLMMQGLERQRQALEETKKQHNIANAVSLARIAGPKLKSRSPVVWREGRDEMVQAYTLGREGLGISQEQIDKLKNMDFIDELKEPIDEWNAALKSHEKGEINDKTLMAAALDFGTKVGDVNLQKQELERAKEQIGEKKEQRSSQAYQRMMNPSAYEFQPEGMGMVAGGTVMGEPSSEDIQAMGQTVSGRAGLSHYEALKGKLAEQEVAGREKVTINVGGVPLKLSQEKVAEILGRKLTAGDIEIAAAEDELKQAGVTKPSPSQMQGKIQEIRERTKATPKGFETMEEAVAEANRVLKMTPEDSGLVATAELGAGNKWIPKLVPNITLRIPPSVVTSTPGVAYDRVKKQWFETDAQGNVIPMSSEEVKQKAIQYKESIPVNDILTMQQSVPSVLQLLKQARQDLEKADKSLGPLAGRWAELWSGKIGADNPEFRRLATDVGLLQTRLMKMHVGARGGVEMMNHFKNYFNAGKDSRKNLEAAFNAVEEYANEVALPLAKQRELAAPQQEVKPTGPSVPQVGEIRGGYKYNGGNPADPNSWEKQ